MEGGIWKNLNMARQLPDNNYWSVFLSTDWHLRLNVSNSFIFQHLKRSYIMGLEHCWILILCKVYRLVFLQEFIACVCVCVCPCSCTGYWIECLSVDGNLWWFADKVYGTSRYAWRVLCSWSCCSCKWPYYKYRWCWWCWCWQLMMSSYMHCIVCHVNITAGCKCICPFHDARTQDCK